MSPIQTTYSNMLKVLTQLSLSTTDEQQFSLLCDKQVFFTKQLQAYNSLSEKMRQQLDISFLQQTDEFLNNPSFKLQPLVVYAKIASEEQFRKIQRDSYIVGIVVGICVGVAALVFCQQIF